MQTSSILSQAIIVTLIISRLPPLYESPPITTIDRLQAVDCWDGKFLTSSLCLIDVL